MEGGVEIVFGVSMTPTTVRMVLVEGAKADGVTVDHDVFEVTADDGSATRNASDQVIAAVLGTREGAVASGHHLAATGVTWSDPAEAAALREALSDRGIEDVMLCSELHAAGTLGQAIGSAVGYDTTALMFIERDTATLAVVQTVDGSIVNAVSRGLEPGDEMAVLTDMVTRLETHEPRPDGIFVVGAGVGGTSVKSYLEKLVSMPLHAPDEPELALPRAAALAAASAPSIDASTVGLAYSRETGDGTTAEAAYPAGFAGEPSQLAADGLDHAQEGRKPFLLAGSALTTIFGVGVVALVVSLAANIQPTADQRPSPGGKVVHPNSLAPAPPPVQNVQPNVPPPAPQTQVPGPLASPPPAPPEQAAPEVAPPPTVVPRSAVPVAPPAAPPPAVGPPPAMAPAPVIELPVPGLPPILLAPGVRPPWYPVPQQPQWRPPWRGHQGWHGDD
jgi:hypothetical protein